ncbi:MAG: DUF262 domain-containing protein [Rhodoferax sp.]|nr:DUF262 domain-containing protein [Rhodoferax sp.]MBP7490688.1 DUF262 domain-containing protein [Rhodoferax sp.]
MTSSLLLNTATPTFGELFTNGRTFAVPRFQRNYKWDEDQWEELWQDLIAAAESDKEHYMGAIVLKTHATRKHFEIIDGQQRLVTLTLFVLAAVKCFESWAEEGHDAPANNERAQLYRGRFLRAKDAASLVETSRLELNRNDAAFFRSTLLQLRKPAAPSRLRESERLMWRAFEYFVSQLQERFGATHDAAGLSHLLDAASDKLLFIQIVVSDEMDAYTVFETLNARGTQLTVTDLLKNYLFSRFGQDEHAIDVAEDQWNRITAIKEKEFPKLLRHYWNSHHGVTRPPRLFKDIRESIKQHDDALALLDELEAVSNLYSALKNPHDELWFELPAARKYVDEVDLFGVTQCYPLLFAAWQHLRHEFVAVLRICAVISFRYIVIGKLNTQPMERAYVDAARKVRKGQISTPAQLLAALRPLYVPDEQFEADFALAKIQTPNKVVRYVLFAIENHLSGNARSRDGDGATVEHILPDNPDEAWMSIFPEASSDVYRLGNYTLLEAGANRRVERMQIADKKVEYQKSGYKLSSNFGWNEWTRTQLNERQQWMAKNATAIWRLNF